MNVKKRKGLAIQISDASGDWTYKIHTDEQGDTVQRKAFTPDDRNVALKFEDFHRKNPLVYDTLVAMTRKWKASGHEKVGLRMLFEIIRWEIGLTTATVDFQINNNYAPFYARKIAREHPDLASMFYFRRSEADLSIRPPYTAKTRTGEQATVWSEIAA